MVALREAVMKRHGGRVTPEQPPKGERQANGAVEEAGRTVRDMAKVLKLQLESKIRREVRMDEPVMEWRIRWAAMSLSRFQVGKDKQTPYQRQVGKRCQVDVVPFGECVWFRRLSESGSRKRSMQSKWEDGIWLGHARNSNEALIGTSRGIM